MASIFGFEDLTVKFLEIDEYLQYRFLAGFLSEDPGFSDKIRGRMASLFSLEVSITKEPRSPSSRNAGNWRDLVSRKSDGERRPSSLETLLRVRTRQRQVNPATYSCSYPLDQQKRKHSEKQEPVTSK